MFAAVGGASFFIFHLTFRVVIAFHYVSTHMWWRVATAVTMADKLKNSAASAPSTHVYVCSSVHYAATISCHSHCYATYENGDHQGGFIYYHPPSLCMSKRVSILIHAATLRVQCSCNV